MLGMIAAGLFAGYVLAYAAVANGGKFAAAPWEALRKSAYDATPGGSSSSHAHTSTWDEIVRGIGFLANPIGSLLP